MPITYSQKQNILEFLFNPINWENRFDLNFFMDEKRKWRFRSDNEINISTNQDKTEIFAVSKQTGAAVHFKKMNDILIIEDESGHNLSIQARAIKIAEGSDLKIMPMNSARDIDRNIPNMDVVEIDNMGAYVGFHGSGAKTVFLDDLGQKINFKKPALPIKQTSHPGQFFHAISFNLAAAEKWGIAPHDLLNAAKLVVSKDMDLEPDLRTINELDPAEAHKYIEYLLTDEYDQTYDGPWQWRPKVRKTTKNILEFQKAWNDSTEFSGHFIDTPRQFFIQTKNDAFDVSMSLRRKKLPS